MFVLEGSSYFQGFEKVIRCNINTLNKQVVPIKCIQFNSKCNHRLYLIFISCQLLRARRQMSVPLDNANCYCLVPHLPQLSPSPLPKIYKNRKRILYILQCCDVRTVMPYNLIIVCFPCILSFKCPTTLLKRNINTSQRNK